MICQQRWSFSNYKWMGLVFNFNLAMPSFLFLSSLLFYFIFLPSWKWREILMKRKLHKREIRKGPKTTSTYLHSEYNTLNIDNHRNWCYQKRKRRHDSGEKQSCQFSLSYIPASSLFSELFFFCCCHLDTFLEGEEKMNHNSVFRWVHN